MGEVGLRREGNIYWLTSYPKSGNTWLRIFLAHLLGRADAHDINRLALEDGQASNRHKFDEIVGVDAAELTQDTIDRLRPRVYETMSDEAIRPLFIKAHDAYQLTPAGEPLFPAKATRGVIHIVRDPRDVAVSLSHYNTKSIDETIGFMAKPDACFSTEGKSLRRQLQVNVLDWSAHAKSWLECPLPTLTVRYEDMLHDSLNTFMQIARFAQIEADENKIQQAIAACSFNRLKSLENNSRFAETPREAERFFRQGKAGGWKESLSGMQLEEIVKRHQPMMRQLGYSVD